MDEYNRVAIYFPSSENLTGGATTFINLIKGLKRFQKLQLLFITEKESELSKQIEDIGVKVKILPFSSLLENKNGEVFEYNFFKKFQILIELLRYNYRFRKIINDENCEVLITRNVKNVIYVGIGAKAAGSKVVWDIGLEPNSRGLIRILHLFSGLLSNVIVIQADNQRSEIFSNFQQKAFKGKFSRIYPGIDEKRMSRLFHQDNKDRINNRELKIVSIGTIVERKNQKMLLEALVELNRESITVDFIGAIRDEKYSNELHEFVLNHDLNGKVNFLGWRSDIPGILGGYDLFVLCSRAEGTPQVIREAMFAGLPVIGTDVGGVGEMIEHNYSGFKVNNFNIDELRNYLQFFLKNRKKIEVFGKRSRIKAKRMFSYDNWIQSYYDILIKLANK